MKKNSNRYSINNAIDSPQWAPYDPGPVFRVSSEAGPRTSPLPGASTSHKGRDFAAPTGTPIPAAADGRVVLTGYEKGWGNFVAIEHLLPTEKIYSLYAHLDQPSPLGEGDEIAQGQLVGLVGATGLASGPHLHFEIICDQPAPFAKGHAVYDPKTYEFPVGNGKATT